jgi:hypothetical protein
MTEGEAIAALDAIQPDAQGKVFGGSDPEEAHGVADEILLKLAGPEVEAAYNRVAERVGAWWYA